MGEKTICDCNRRDAVIKKGDRYLRNFTWSRGGVAAWTDDPYEACLCDGKDRLTARIARAVDGEIVSRKTVCPGKHRRKKPAADNSACYEQPLEVEE